MLKFAAQINLIGILGQIFYIIYTQAIYKQDNFIRYNVSGTFVRMADIILLDLFNGFKGL